MAQAARPANAASQPGTGPDGGVASELEAGPGDAVAISAAALARLRLGVLALAVQRLGALLEALDPAVHLASRGDPSTLADLASGIGTAAQEVGMALSSGEPAPGAIGVAADAAMAGPAPGEGPSPPSRETPIAAGALLRAAAEAVAGVKVRLQGALISETADSSPAFVRVADTMAVVARCEAQVALAIGQLAAPSHPLAGPRSVRWGRGALVAPASGRGGDAPDKQWLPGRAWFSAVLLCAATAALWVATTLDLTLARAACAVVAVVLGAAGAWRALGPRLPRGARVVVEPDRTS